MKFREFRSIIKENATFPIPYHQEFVEKMSHFEIAAQERTPITPYFRRIVMSFSSFVIVLLAFFGYLTSLRVVDVVTLDINPSVEININPFGRVIQVLPGNEDALILVNQLDHSKGNLETVLLDIYDKSIELGYSSQDETFMLLGITSNSYDSEMSMTSKIDQIYDSFPITVLTLNKHSTVEYVYFSGFVDDSQEASANFDGIFANGDEISTTTIYNSETDITDAPAYDSEYYANKIAEFDSMTSSDFTTMANNLGISEAKLQLVLSIFFYYPVYQVQNGITMLSDLPLQTLIPLYNAIP